MRLPRLERSTSRVDIALRGGVALYVMLLVVLPLATLVKVGFGGGVAGALAAITSPVAQSALVLTLWTSLLVAVVGGVMGVVVAWVLVRYRFPGRGLLSAFVDLPLAIPTLVAGMAIVALLGPQTVIGAAFAAVGVKIAFAEPAIVLALAFVSLPFTVRAVEPVLMELDPAEEEAASTLGASGFLTLRRVILPPLLPAIGSGAAQAFSRALAEFGSIVVVAGNIPNKTLTAPVYVFGEIESGFPEAASAVAVALIGVALLSTLSAQSLERLATVNRG
ncbi:MAG: sulfate ABC transporter permease subunit [Proteobacteria bacterium]|jgi:sulfate transport system permease protein|nr:sulfate ABC transporter permease subunit [Pseudomonadota bacterium]